MFLDDELLKIGREVDIDDRESVISAIKVMIQACFRNVSEGIAGDKSMPTIQTNFKRVNNTWIRVANQLEKEGKGFVNEDGFKMIVESKFKGITL